MQFMPTNDVFHHLLRLLQIHKDKDLLLEIFQNAGVADISKSKITSWDTKTGKPSRMYREMPREILDKFIDQLYVEKLVEGPSSDREVVNGR